MIGKEFKILWEDGREDSARVVFYRADCLSFIIHEDASIAVWNLNENGWGFPVYCLGDKHFKMNAIVKHIVKKGVLDTAILFNKFSIPQGRDLPTLMDKCAGDV